MSAVVAAPSSALVAAPSSALVAAPASTPAPVKAPAPAPSSDALSARVVADDAAVAGPSPTPAREAGFVHPPGLAVDASRPTCTQAQLRRFIKSRPWVPMHELRRRFGIDGVDDDVSPIRVGAHTLFIGLPVNEGRIMAELLGGGDVGYELSMDPVTPVVVGVYPMRPIPRS